MRNDAEIRKIRNRKTISRKSPSDCCQSTQYLPMVRKKNVGNIVTPFKNTKQRLIQHSQRLIIRALKKTHLMQKVTDELTENEAIKRVNQEK